MSAIGGQCAAGVLSPLPLLLHTISDERKAASSRRHFTAKTENAPQGVAQLDLTP